MITAKDVKELREKTSAGMMDCKKALTECDGDMEKAIDWLREKGIAKAAKKSDRIAAEGLTRVGVEGDKAVIFEVNSETDFVAKNDQFLTLLEDIKAALFANAPTTLEEALATNMNGVSISDALTSLTATIGEKITLRRFEIVEKGADEVFGSYMHMGGKISAIVKLKGSASDEVAKDIAMQVASMNPSYISRNEIPTDVVEHEKKVQLEIMKNDPKLASKPEKVLEGILEGKISKHFKDQCLNDQEFFKNPDLKVAQYAKEAKSEVINFVRYGVGEGIEKREDNFAEEVMSQAFGK